MTHPTRRELVCLVHSKDQLDRILSDLIEDGFTKDDISLLTSHQALDDVDMNEEEIKTSVTEAMGEDLKLVGPIATAGLIMLATAPFDALIAGAIAAGLGVVAIKNILEGWLSEHALNEYADAVQAGSIVVWINAETREQEMLARAVLDKGSAENIHIFDPKEDAA